MCLAQCLQSPPCPDPALSCEQHLNVTVGPLVQSCASRLQRGKCLLQPEGFQTARACPASLGWTWDQKAHNLTFQEDLPLGESLR